MGTKRILTEIVLILLGMGMQITITESTNTAAEMHSVTHTTTESWIAVQPPKKRGQFGARGREKRLVSPDSDDDNNRNRNRREIARRGSQGREDGSQRYPLQSSPLQEGQQFAFASWAGLQSELQRQQHGVNAEPQFHLRHGNARIGEQPQSNDGLRGAFISEPVPLPFDRAPAATPRGRSTSVQPPSVLPYIHLERGRIVNSSPHAANSRALQGNGSPMPLEEISTINNAQGCLPTEDGNYGSQDGDQVNVFFFYQVEASPGTTETQINGIILDDIEITLLDSMLPMFFQECGAATAETTRIENGKYVGMSSKPADFVLRGFECTDKATEPCFIISGSMTAYTVNLNLKRAQTEMRIAIYKVMDSGTIAAKISRVNGVALLDDSLNLATLPTTNAPSPRPTQPPTRSPTTVAPTPSPTTTSPSPTTTAPTPLPTTDEPTEAPSTSTPTETPTTETPTTGPTALPTTLPTAPPTTSTSAPATREPTVATSPTSESTADNPIVTTAPTTDLPSLPANTSQPISLQTETPTAAPIILNGTSTPPLGNWSEAPSPSPAPFSEVGTDTTLQPTQQPTQESTYFVMDNEEHKSAFQKVPIWVWVILALAICICCSYADPDEDEDEAGVNQTIREQERASLANLHNDHDKDRDSMHDSEAFSSVEYVRKLYRQ